MHATAAPTIGTKNRVQMDFSADALHELDQLKLRIGAASRAEVFRYSLRTLQWVLEQLESNTRIIVEADGQSREVVFPFLRVNSMNKQIVSEAMEAMDTSASDFVASPSRAAAR